MGILITSPGLLTTIQDLGRFGFMSMGFSPSGAMDTDSLVIANKILCNNDSEGALEMTYMGISCKFTENCVISLTGADMNFEIDEKPAPMYQPIEIKKGMKLTSKTAIRGMRSYMAVAGGFDIEPVMGSYSTNLKCKIGGYLGRKIMRDDDLPLRLSREQLLGTYKAHSITPPMLPDDEAEIRVVLGPQDDYFSKKGIDTFLNSEYIVTNESDRMGIRLDGEAIEAIDGVDIISDGIAAGSIQIPSSGKPIIMMADRQTTGGYAKIATVIPTDIAVLAQCKPNTKITFKAVSLKEAEKIIIKHKKDLAWLDYRLMF